MVNAALLEREASGALMSHAVAWDTKNKLEFPVPYSDLKPTIFLGTCTCIVKFCDIHQIHVCYYNRLNAHLQKLSKFNMVKQLVEQSFMSIPLINSK